MNTLGRIEILKGPSSSIYGAGLGGTIQLIPNKGEFSKMNINGGYTFGSYGLRKYSLQANMGDLKNSANITYSNTHSDGYRDNNELDRQTITVATNHFFGDTGRKRFSPSELLTNPRRKRLISSVIVYNRKASSF